MTDSQASQPPSPQDATDELRQAEGSSHYPEAEAAPSALPGVVPARREHGTQTTPRRYAMRLDFTAADDAQAERLAEAWADTCAAEYQTTYRGLVRVSDGAILVDASEGYQPTSSADGKATSDE